jgi:hypothetical protein
MYQQKNLHSVIHVVDASPNSRDQWGARCASFDGITLEHHSNFPEDGD